MRYNNKCHTALTLISIFFLVSVASAATDHYSGISPNISAPRTFQLETKLLDAFNKNQCADIHSIASYEQYNRATALSLAIIAFCTDDKNLSEKLFEEAQHRDSRSQIISLLRTKQKTENVHVPWNYYLIPQLGTGYETNPLLSANPSSSTVFETQISSGVQHRLSFGVLSANLNSANALYLSNRTMDSWSNDLEIPLFLRVGSHEDLRIQPFGTFRTRRGTPYYWYEGFSVAAIVYRGKYRQALEGKVYQDNYQPIALRVQQGTHFRFNYSWEFYPDLWFVRFTGSVEHLQAGRMRTASGNNIPYSNNEYGLQTFIEYNFSDLVFGLLTQLTLRQDTNASVYNDINKVAQSKSRQDFTILFSPSVAIHIGPEVFLIFSYKREHRRSNMGEADYANLNYANEAFLTSLRIAWGNL